MSGNLHLFLEITSPSARGFVIVRKEGGDYEWVDYPKWRQEILAGEAPIFGVWSGHRVLFYDRILDASGQSPWRTMIWPAKLRQPSP